MTLQGGLMSRALTFFPLCREGRPPSHCIAQGFPNSGAGLLPGPFVHPLHQGLPAGRCGAASPVPKTLEVPERAVLPEPVPEDQRPACR